MWIVFQLKTIMENRFHILLLIYLKVDIIAGWNKWDLTVHYIVSYKAFKYLTDDRCKLDRPVILSVWSTLFFEDWCPIRSFPFWYSFIFQRFLKNYLKGVCNAFNAFVFFEFYSIFIMIFLLKKYTLVKIFGDKGR